MNPPAPTRTRQAGRKFRGFTLVEMVVSLAVIGVLLAGMGGAIVLASKALPHASNPAGATVDAARALHELRDELRAATELPTFGATSVTLHLPDRDGDGRPEVVTYAWAGTAGDPLTRAANGNAGVTVLDNVQNFALDYVCGKQDTVFPGATFTSEEVELSSHDPGDSSDTLQLAGSNRLGFRFTPTPSADAQNWRVTRLLMRTSAHATDNGQATFELAGWDAGVGPNSNLVESIDVPESQLDQAGGWAEVDFVIGGPFAIGDTASVTLIDSGTATAANITWNDRGTPANAHSSSDDGATWEPRTTEGAFDQYVYGTYQSTGDDWTFTRQRVTSIDLELVHGGADAVTHALTLPLPNAPEAAAALWESDFNADPTTLDYKDNGVADWQDDGGFDTADLADGQWEATDTLRSAPDSVALDTPFAVDLWARDTVDNGDGGGVQLRFDRAGGLQAYVSVEIELISSGQIVRLLSKDAAGVGVTWHTQTQPAGGNVHVALAVDPTNDTVGVMIDGEAVGSFTYEQFSGSNNDVLRPFVDGSASGVYLDHLRLSTGGTAAVTPGAYAVSSGGSGTSGTSAAETSGTSNALTGGTDTSGTTESSKSSGNWWESLF